MKVRMTEPRNISGHGLKEIGSVVDFPDDLAKQLIAQGFAEAISDAKAKPKAPPPVMEE